MKFKVDENLPIELAYLLNEVGHDAVTVHDEKLGGAHDDDIAPACQRECRAFLTFDLGFSDIRSYPPSKYLGLVVFRLKSQDRPHVLKVCERLLEIMKIEGVERGYRILSVVGRTTQLTQRSPRQSRI